MDIAQGFTELRLSLAKAHARLRAAKDQHEQVAAYAEQLEVEHGNITGKNKEDRDRQMVIRLSENETYLEARANLRHAEHEVDRLEALLEGARDARRVDEWRIRAQLVEALNRAVVASDHEDRAGEGAFDDALGQQVDNAIFEHDRMADNRQLMRQGQTEEDVHWQQHMGTYDRGTEEFEELPF